MNPLAIFSLVSLLVTSVILFLNLSKGVKLPIEKKFLLLIISLFIWQFEELLLRSSYFSGFILKSEKYFSFFFIAIGYLIFDLISELNLFESKGFFWAKLILIITSLVVYVEYLTYELNFVLYKSEIFGNILGFREMSNDILLPFLMSLELTVSLILIVRILYFQRNEVNRVRILFYALLLVTIYSLITQVVIPMFYNITIPGVSVLIIFFLLAFYILIKENYILVNFNSENLYKRLNRANALYLVYDNDGKVLYGNSLTKNLFDNNNSIIDFRKVPKLLSNILPQIKGDFNPYERVDEMNFFFSEEKIGNDYFQFANYTIFDKRKIIGGFILGFQDNRNLKLQKSILSSFDSFKRSRGLPKSFLINVDIKDRVILLNEQLYENYQFFNKRRYTYFEFYILLKNILNIDDFKQVIRLSKLTPEQLFENNLDKLCFNVNTDSSFYSFEIGFKKFDPHVISNNNIIYVSDATDNNIAELENNWVNKNVPWIVSHVLRKPVANVLGLLDIIGSDDLKMETFSSSPELIKLINQEIRDLDAKLDQFISNYDRDN